MKITVRPSQVTGISGVCLFLSPEVEAKRFFSTFLFNERGCINSVYMKSGVVSVLMRPISIPFSRRERLNSVDGTCPMGPEE